MLILLLVLLVLLVLLLVLLAVFVLLVVRVLLVESLACVGVLLFRCVGILMGRCVGVLVCCPGGWAEGASDLRRRGGRGRLPQATRRLRAFGMYAR